MTEPNILPGEAWPSLALDAWQATYATLHMWTQIVGKIRLAQTPWTNHSWHVTLYVTPRGLTTGSIPYGARAFQIDFDFIAHELKLQSNDGGAAGFPLGPQSVAVFYRRLKEEMTKLDLEVKINLKPNEVLNVFIRSRRNNAAYERSTPTILAVILPSDAIFKNAERVSSASQPGAFLLGAHDMRHALFRRLAPASGGVPIFPIESARGLLDEVAARILRGRSSAYHAYYSTLSERKCCKAQLNRRPLSTAPIPGVHAALRRVRMPSSRNVLLDFRQTTYEAAATCEMGPGNSRARYL